MPKHADSRKNDVRAALLISAQKRPIYKMATGVTA